MSDGREVLEQYGLRVTPQRLGVWKALSGNREHPSADKVYRAVRKMLPNISFDTVNRTLVHFAELGLVHVVEGTSEVKRYDPVTREHHHMRCVKCGRILDFENEGYNSLAVPQEVTRQFQIIRKRVVLEGLCRTCRRQ